MGIGIAHIVPVTAALGTLEATQIGLFTVGGASLATGLAVAVALRLAETLAILVGLACLATAPGAAPERLTSRCCRRSPRVLFAVGWLPVFVLRSERFHARRARRRPRSGARCGTPPLAIAAHVTLAEVALHDACARPEARRSMVGTPPGDRHARVSRRVGVLDARAPHPRRLRPSPRSRRPTADARHPWTLRRRPPPARARHGDPRARPRRRGRDAAHLDELRAWWSSRWRGAVVQDEQELYATFGDAYAAYAATTTSRLIPFVW